jgi:hypothetical protein
MTLHIKLVTEIPARLLDLFLYVAPSEKRTLLIMIRGACDSIRPHIYRLPHPEEAGFVSLSRSLCFSSPFLSTMTLLGFGSIFFSRNPFWYILLTCAMWLGGSRRLA